MKKYIRAISALAICCFTIFSSACSKSETLTARSVDYVNISLKESELKAEELDSTLWLENGGYSCYVSKTSGYSGLSEVLAINNGRKPHITYCCGSNGYYIGRDHTKFMSGIDFHYYTGVGKNLPKPDAESFPQGRCVALLEVDSKDYCYAVTSWNMMSEAKEPISLYRMWFPSSDRAATAEKICDITPNGEYAIDAILTKDETVYVATGNGLYVVTKDGTVTKMAVPAEWNLLAIDSMVMIDKHIYFGSLFGVLRYTVDDGAFTWFVANYRDIVPQK